MRSTLLLLTATLITSPVALSDDTPLALERGAVHDGSVTTTAGQDWFAQQRRIARELEAEHLLATLHQGGLSSSELEAVARVLTDPNVAALLATSAYHEAVFQGRVVILPN
ncbi:MAG: hypothetical protein EOM26_13580 [Alphaproteobacteria bacterium]|jgi:hypothetical protein|nr:hypothetical protein [Alphaproteobacteria bacterium]